MLGLGPVPGLAASMVQVPVPELVAPLMPALAHAWEGTASEVPGQAREGRS